MSASKVKARSQKLSSLREDLVKIVVDNTDGAFHIAKQSDGAGEHFMLYLDEDFKDKIDLNNFRYQIYEKLGRAKVIISFVDNNYIETFLRE